PGNCIIAAAGNLTHEALLAEVERQGWFDIDGKPGAPLVAPPVPPVPPAVRSVRRAAEKDTAQTHIVFATDTIPYADRRKYSMVVLSNIFGGGMSSRLFQRVREELGLAYAIYSFTSFYRAVGMAGVYVGTQPARAEKATAAIRDEYARLAREGVRGGARAIKTAEDRVALVPAGAESLASDGHSVLVEQGAGLGAGFADDAYRAAGAEIAPSAEGVWSRAEMVLKVKEPIEPEWSRIRKGQVVFTYFHFAASEALTKAIIKSGSIAIAYETVELPTKELPLLTPMSEVAGRMAVQEGAKYLEKVFGGSG